MLAPRKKLYSTPSTAADCAARLLDLRSGDKVLDIGCGDGRVLINLATKASTSNPLHKIHFCGIEIESDRAQEAIENVKAANLDSVVDIRCENALSSSALDDATAVFLYLVPRGLGLIKRRILEIVEKRRDAKRLSQRVDDGDRGSKEPMNADHGEPLLRVVTYMCPFEGEQYVRKETCKVNHQPGAEWPIYLFHFR